MARFGEVGGSEESHGNDLDRTDAHREGPRLRVRRSRWRLRDTRAKEGEAPEDAKHYTPPGSISLMELATTVVSENVQAEVESSMP